MSSSARSRAQVAAYMIVAFIAAWGLYSAQQATTLAREVDHRGDIRACTQENLLRSESNRRDAALQKTAALMVDSLAVIRQSDRPKDDETNKRLREIAREAEKVRTKFPPSKLVDCDKIFPGP